MVSGALVDAIGHAEVGTRLNRGASRRLSRVEARLTHLNYEIKLALLDLNAKSITYKSPFKLSNPPYRNQPSYSLIHLVTRLCQSIQVDANDS